MCSFFFGIFNLDSFEMNGNAKSQHTYFINSLKTILIGFRPDCRGLVTGWWWWYGYMGSRLIANWIHFVFDAFLNLFIVSASFTYYMYMFVCLSTAALTWCANWLNQNRTKGKQMKSLFIMRLHRIRKLKGNSAEDSLILFRVQLITS